MCWKLNPDEENSKSLKEMKIEKNWIKSKHLILVFSVEPWTSLG